MTYTYVMFFAMTLLLLCPYHGFGYTYRWQLLKCLGSCFMTPFVRVTFAANIVGDILTSMSVPLADLSFTGCFLVRSAVGGDKYKGDSPTPVVLRKEKSSSTGDGGDGTRVVPPAPECVGPAAGAATSSKGGSGETVSTAASGDSTAVGSEREKPAEQTQQEASTGESTPDEPTTSASEAEAAAVEEASGAAADETAADDTSTDAEAAEQAVPSRNSDDDASEDNADGPRRRRRALLDEVPGGQQPFEKTVHYPAVDFASSTATHSTTTTFLVAASVAAFEMGGRLLQQSAPGTSNFLTANNVTAALGAQDTSVMGTEEFLGQEPTARNAATALMQYESIEGSAAHFCHDAIFHRYKFLRTALAFPFVIRLLQCFRRYYDHRETKHLLNAGKYTVSLAVNIIAAYMKGMMSIYLLVFMYVSATLYNATWDYLMDWGFACTITDFPRGKAICLPPAETVQGSMSGSSPEDTTNADLGSLSPNRNFGRHAPPVETRCGLVAGMRKALRRAQRRLGGLLRKMMFWRHGSGADDGAGNATVGSRKNSKESSVQGKMVHGSGDTFQRPDMSRKTDRYGMDDDDGHLGHHLQPGNVADDEAEERAISSPPVLQQHRLMLLPSVYYYVIFLILNLIGRTTWASVLADVEMEKCSVSAKTPQCR